MANGNPTLGAAELRLQPDTASPSKARRFGLEAAHRWRIDIDEDALALVLSEMVTAAIEHGDDPVTLHHILVHVTADTQRHAGHADIIRELIDGSVGMLRTESAPILTAWSSVRAAG